MGQVWMGFEGQAFVGAAGSTAATQITERVDIKVAHDNDTADTTVAGDGMTIPQAAEQVVCRKFSATISIKRVAGSATFETLMAAATTNVIANSMIALRLKDNVAGKGFDGDVNVSLSQDQNLKDPQTVEFTLSANNRLRAWQPYV